MRGRKFRAVRVRCIKRADDRLFDFRAGETFRGFCRTIEIDAGQFFRGTGTLFGSPSTIDATGLVGSGAITIRHGGQGVTPFVVGDATTNGTAGALTTAEATSRAFHEYVQANALDEFFSAWSGLRKITDEATKTEQTAATAAASVGVKIPNTIPPTMMIGVSSGNAAARAARQFLPVGTREFACPQGKIEFVCREDIKPTPNTLFRRIEVRVYVGADESHHYAEVIGILGNEAGS